MSPERERHTHTHIHTRIYTQSRVGFGVGGVVFCGTA